MEISTIQRRPTGPVVPPPEPVEPETTPQADAQKVDGTPAPPAGVRPAMQYDERTGVDVVQFRDNRTDEVVHQLPTKAVLAFIEAAQAAEKKRSL
jgi:hypothetical protein